MNYPFVSRITALLVWVLPTSSVAAPVDSASAPSVATLNVTPADEPGTMLVISGVVVDREGKPVSDVELHIYQTDASGRYTLDKPMDEPHARLAGFLKAPDGRFELRTIRPGGYTKTVHLGDQDRHIPAHIHVDVTAPGHAERRLQVVFADDPLLRDPYWTDWVAKLRQPVLTVERDGTTLRGRLVITLD